MYAQLDDHFYMNPKVLKVSFAARGLYCQALSYAVHHLTDGALTEGAVQILGGPGWAPMVAELMTAGLWEATEDGGYGIHDFLKHNRSGSDVKAAREALRARQDTYRKRNALVTRDARVTETFPLRVSASSRRNELRRSRAPRQNLQEARVKQEKEREIASPTTIQQSATATSNPRAENAALRDGFVTFWAAYPARQGRRNGKQAALDAWMRLAPSLALQRGILEAVGTYAASTDLPCDAVRWLKGRRWEDEKVFVAGLVDLEEPVKAPVYEKPADGGAMGRLIRAGMPPPVKGVWRDD